MLCVNLHFCGHDVSPNVTGILTPVHRRAACLDDDKDVLECVGMTISINSVNDVFLTNAIVTGLMYLSTRICKPSKMSL